MKLYLFIFVIVKQSAKETKEVVELQSNVESVPNVPALVKETVVVSEAAEEDEVVPEPEGKENKPVFIKMAHDCTVKEGGSARFDVKVSGFPEPFIDWFTNGKMIEESEVYKIEETEHGYCALNISDVDREDAGIYKCIAENDEGTITCEAELKVQGKSNLNLRTA